MSRVAVIGIGSPYGADRLGWDVVERMRTDDDREVDYECWNGPLTGLVQRFQELDAVILVDAALNDEPVGLCRMLTSTQLAGQGLCWSSHGLGLADAVALGRALHALPARLIIVAAEVGDPTLSAPPEVAVHNAVAAVTSGLQTLGHEPIA
ncbi:MAG: hydrogenase maturation protease [Gammaproteobacteria bacterium]|jgi:hydrogenase maturation protease